MKNIFITIMKTFKKIALFVLVSAMVLSAAACGASDKDSNDGSSQSVSDTAGKKEVDYSGEYVETVAQRASVSVTKGENGYDIWIRWPNSVDEAVNWTFSGTFDENGVLSYSGCEKSVVKFDENGNDTLTTEYTDGTGKLMFADNALTWQDDKENAGNEAVFALQ